MSGDAAIGPGGGSDTVDRPLIFEPGPRSRFPWRLGLMIGASLLVHAGSFYVLQVAYTPTGSQLPPPAQVTLVPLERPENGPLARWLAMDDPALTTRAPAPGAAQVLASLGFHYVPSYDAAPPPFKPLATAQGTVNTTPPRLLVPGPVPIAPPRFAAPARDRSNGQRTQVLLSGAVSGAANQHLPPVQLRIGESANVLDPTVFLLGVHRGEGAPFVFRQSTSGNAAADEYARAYLTALPFSPIASDGDVIWGTATFYWGNDVYR